MTFADVKTACWTHNLHKTLRALLAMAKLFTLRLLALSSRTDYCTAVVKVEHSGECTTVQYFLFIYQTFMLSDEN